MSLRYRPFAVIGFTVLSVLMLSMYVDGMLARVFIAAGVLLLVLSAVFRKIRNAIFPLFVAGSLIFGGCLYISGREYNAEQAEALTGNEIAVVEGVLTDYPEYTDSRYYYLMKTVSVDGKDACFDLRLSLPYDIDAEPYDNIKGEFKLYLIGKSAGMDIERYFRSKGIYFGAYCENDDMSNIVVSAPENRPLRYHIIRLRAEIENRILDKLPNEYGGTVVALLLGDKSFISDETKSALYESGVAPIFAVSGLHLSIWVLGLFSVLEMLKVRKRINSAVNIIFTLFFMALTGFSPSVCRSGLMMIIYLSANLFYRKTDSLNSLGLAAFILCAVNPLIVADNGFLMSFSATLGIVFLMHPFKNKILPDLRFNVSKAFLSAVAVSVFAVIGSFPITVFFIGYISLFSVLSSLLVTYAATVCMIFAGITAVLFKIRFLSNITAFVSGIFAKYVLFIVRTINSFSVKSIVVSDIFWKSGVILCFAALVFALVFLKKSGRVKFIAVALSLVITITSLCSVFYYKGLTEVNVLDSGNGIAVVVSHEHKKYLLKGRTNGFNTVYNLEDTLKEVNRKAVNCVLIADESFETDTTTLGFIKRNRTERIIIPAESRTIGNLVKNDSITVSRNAELDFWSGGKINYYLDEGGAYAYCTFDANSFLIIFNDKFKSDIPKRYRKADFFITCGFIPEEVDVSSFKAIFVSASGKKSDNICKYVTYNGGRCFSTDRYGNITVKIKNEKYKIIV